MNDTQANFSWIPLYEEFADKLVIYKDARTSLIDIVSSVYETTGIKQPKLDSANPPSGH